MIRSKNIILMLVLAGAAGTTMGAEKKPMDVAEVIAGAVQRVPGPTEEVERFLQAPGGAKKVPNGWFHPRIVYRAGDGAILHIELVSDWQNTTAPDVVRFMVSVDGSHCVDAVTLKDDLARLLRVSWTESPSGGWLAKSNGRFLSLGTAHGRCLVLATVDDRIPQRPAPPTVRHPVRPDGLIRPQLFGH